MVVKWEDSHPHCWKEVDKIRFGTVFYCKVCNQYRWLPDTMSDTSKLQEFVRKHGVQKGYNLYLNYRPDVKIALWAVQNKKEE